MASHRKQSEGIALLSIYGDEEDDEEMEDVEEQPQTRLQEEPMEPQSLTPAENDTVSAHDNYNSYDKEEDESRVSDDGIRPLMLAGEQSEQPEIVESGNYDPNDSHLGPSPGPTQQHMMVSVSVSRSSRRAGLSIVDYAHDEMAMSPEPEDGEIMVSGRVMYGEELQRANGHVQEIISSGTTQGSPASIQVTPPQSSEQTNKLNVDVTSYTLSESKVAEVEEVMVPSEETGDVYPVDKFLPSPPKEKCSDELQDRIKRFLKLKKDGRSYNAEVRNRKDYRNPDFLLHAVTYQDIDQIGSCFRKDVFHPHGYDKSDFYDEIEADMRSEMERKEQERKRSQIMEFTPGGTQLGTVPTPKINVPIPGLNSVPATMDVAKDGRHNKKSKWDKVDGDPKNPLSVAANAALLSAAHAGTGYTAFAQQRRRESEDKRSSVDKRLERRS